MDLTLLQKFLDNNSIPKIKEKQKTFLGIAKQPHYENVLSNIYAFFFDVNEEHGMNDLFLRSFQELIYMTELGEKKNIELHNNFTIETERGTKGGGRIDLLLSSDHHAIIIENKVKHHLDNDLKDYWNSVLLNAPDNNKVGVVLSLRKYSQVEIYHSQFINISHEEFLNQVMKNSGPYLSKATDKYIVFLKDLYQNIMNLSNTMEKEKIEFYYKNQVQLNNAVNLKFAVGDYIKNEIEQACGLIEKKLNFRSPKLGSDNEKRLRYFVSPVCDDLMFTIVFDGLLDQKKELLIMLEVKNNAIVKLKDLKKENFELNEQAMILDEFYLNTNTSWAHFASSSYVLTEEEVRDLQGVIKNKIENDGLLSVHKKVETHLIKEIVDELDGFDFI